MKIKHWLPWVVLVCQVFLFGGTLLAEEVAVTASVDAEKIGLDDVLIYTVTFKGIQNPGQPDLSSLDHFKVAQSSRSFRQEIINGAFSTYTDFTFYLTPQNTGVFNIPPVSYNYQGREYKTASFTIQVVKGSVKPQASGRQRRSIFDDDFFSSPFERARRQPQEIDVRLRAAVSRKDVVQGEQVMYRVLLYSRNSVETINMVSNQTIPGFWQEWYPTPKTIDGTVESLDGKNYRVYEIRKAALFPTNSGSVTIPSMKFEIAIRESSFSFFAERKRIFRSTPAVTLNVAPLPAAAQGLPVGDFDFSLNADRGKININDILTVKLRIAGKGNIKTIEVPGLESCDYFKVYPAKISRHNQYNDSYLSGVVEAEIPVTFKESGLISFPALEFTYYDPSLARLVTKESKPFAVTVSGQKEKPESAATIPRTEIVQKGEDIDFIKTGRIHDQRDRFYKSPLFVLLAVIFFVSNLLFVLKIVVYDKVIARSPLLEKKRLFDRTTKALKAVRDYGEIFPVIENYLKDKAGLGLAGINNYSIEGLFEKYGVGNSDIKTFVRIKAESESARFSPQKKSPKELKQDLKLLIDVLKRIDAKIK